MFPNQDATEPTRASFPRVSGDVPEVMTKRTNNSQFSPRERGCSHDDVPDGHRAGVFPA